MSGKCRLPKALRPTVTNEKREQFGRDREALDRTTLLGGKNTR